MGRRETACGTNREQQAATTLIQSIKVCCKLEAARLRSLKAAYVRYSSEITCRLSWNE